MAEAVQTTRGFNAIFIHSTLDDAGLTAAQFRVLAHISRRAGDGTAWAANESMARVCRLDVKTVTAALKFLEQVRVLRRKPRPGRTTMWRVNPPSEWRIPKLDSPIETQPVWTPGSESTLPVLPPTTLPVLPPRKVIPSRESIKVIQEESGDRSLPPEAATWNRERGQRRVLPLVSGWGRTRAKKLAERRAEPGWAENFEAAVKKVAASDFCNGKNERGWRASLDWLLNPDVVNQVIEGQYDNKKPTQATAKIAY